MGWIDKIKNILFEEDEIDETMSDIPVYTKKEIKEEVIDNQQTSQKKEETLIKDDEPIVSTPGTRFKNVKRDIDLDFDINEQPKTSNVDLLDTQEIIAELEKEVDSRRSEPVVSQKTQVEKPLSQRRSVFQSFDAEAFEQLNGRVNKSENDARRREEELKKKQNEQLSMSQARMANNNFSATKPTRREDDSDRYKLEEPLGKKPFRPSPVISPVYGILDKNYTASEIVDKKDGMKREKINTIVRTPDIKFENKTIEEAEMEADINEPKIEEINIDSVRNKAFAKKEVKEETKYEEVIEKTEEIKVEKQADSIDDNFELPEEIEKVIDKSSEETDERLKSRFVKDETIIDDEDDITSTLLDDEPSYVPEEKFEVEEDNDNNYEGESLLSDVEDKKVSKAHILDDIEKTSTLQILDDIEKELNSIKAVTNADEDGEEITEEERLERSDTLENDLFNLIDSMYDDGEEDEEDND